METVVFDGVAYIKASHAAKEFKYTSDYIGQLCRAKKIDARLVGRTWFVNPESLVEHKRNRHSQLVKKDREEQKQDIASKTKIHRKSVPAVLTPKTVKVSKTTVNKMGQRERSLAVAYEPDEEALLPSLTRKVPKPPRRIRIEHANATRIHIAAEKTTSVFAADPLPEVSLSGSLTVTDYPDVDENEEESLSDEENVLNNKVISDEVALVKPKVKRVTVVEIAGKRKQKVNIVADFADKKTVLSTDFEKKIEKATISAKRIESPLQPDKKSRAKAGLQSTISSFAPQMVQQAAAMKEMPLMVLISPLIASVLALVCVTVLFSASSQVIVADTVYESQVVLQVANLLQVLQP
ncbi:hypothetical protein H6786_02650 [Candidatus Nomurabacteria bacterium]|nr:hypothetical protein [Candidatus Nomurabacteria bacterium]